MSRQVPRVRVGAYFALEATRTNKTNKHDWQHNAQAREHAAEQWTMKSGQEPLITTLTERFPTRRPFGAGYTGFARNFTSQRRFKGYRRVRFQDSRTHGGDKCTR